MDENPCQIQSGPARSESVAPLFLFHDAGGTVFQYSCLGNLHRPVYGISNPRIEQGGKWEHGIRQMGVVYAHMVRSVVQSGPILLGGELIELWEMGQA